MKRTTKTYLLIILVFALVGAIIILPLGAYLSGIEKNYCKPAIEKYQNDTNNVPLCEKLTPERLREAHNAFCEDGILYSLDKVEPCINGALFFPFFPWAFGLHPDAGPALFLPVIIYGAIIGSVLGLMVCTIIFFVKKRNKNA